MDNINSEVNEESETEESSCHVSGTIKSIKVTHVDENPKSVNDACLSSENKAFELEFIKAYEQLPILWNTKHTDYTNKYRRAAACESLVKIMKKWDNTATQFTVRQKINILRSCYRKFLRRRRSSRAITLDGEVINKYYPKNWKFQALSFLGGEIDEDDECMKNNSIEEINIDDASLTHTYEVGLNEESETDDYSSHINGTLQSVKDDTYDQNQMNNETKKKRVKLEVHDYFTNNNILDVEFNAIGSNVVCKLKRMNPEQRCHAELLINKVLIEGLKNNLTDDTDLTEVLK